MESESGAMQRIAPTFLALLVGLRSTCRYAGGGRGRSERATRRDVGMSLRELERKSGVARGLLSRYETGKVKHPNAVFLRAIAAALGVTVDWMME